MTEEALDREAIAVFEAMLDVPEGDRDAWLAERCLDRPTLRERVEAMRAGERIASLRTGGANDDGDLEVMPERIGVYRIVERIGRGGMGSVYRGERDVGDFAHHVAIKVIRLGALSSRLVERFGQERATLARLRHPNIAQLYDGGEIAPGAPFLVMEYIDGQPLLEWMAEHDASRATRQQLFGQICAAVAFAHRNLIVHRDITPANVLVTRDGVAKLIDFGIAKPADIVADPARPSAPSSLASLSLTPGYAAPERTTGGEVTTATDVYSLGRLLERVIPPTFDDRELRAIVARAAAEAPADRYPTVDALASDVDAWARGLPVAAIGGGRRYRFVKFVRRHAWSVGGASAAVLLLIAALGLTLSAYARADAARRAEAARFTELRSLANYTLFELNGELERVVGNTRARTSLADRAQVYLSALAASPVADDALRLEAARGLITLARAQGVPTQPNLGESEQARRNLRTAVAVLQKSGPSVASSVARADALAATSMIEAHFDANTKQAGTTLGGAEAALGVVPLPARAETWHAARRHVRYAQIELATLDQATDELARQTGLLETEIAARPAAMRSSHDAMLDRAYLFYLRGLHGYFTDALDDGLRALRRSETMLADAERRLPNDPVTLNAILWNAYVAYGVTSGLPGRAAESRRYLDLAIRTSGRLIQLEGNDLSLRQFSGNLLQAQAEALSAAGDHVAAIAIQRDVIESRRSSTKNDRRANRLAIAQATMGNFARAANDRPLACASYRAARGHIAELAQRGRPLGTIDQYRADLDINLKLCADNGPLAAMAVVN